MSRFKLLLDIDGPLNPYGMSRDQEADAGYVELPKSTAMLSAMFGGHPGARVTGRLDDGERLMTFAAEMDAELMWATMWNDEANAVFGPEIGLPWLPVVHMSRYDPLFAASWKFGPVREQLRGEAFAWFDDDFQVNHRKQTHFHQSRPEPTLMVDVAPTKGLRDKHFEQVRIWANQERDEWTSWEGRD